MNDVNMQRPLNKTKAVTDLSPRVVSLARMIDRLPPGRYRIQINKTEIEPKNWCAEIERVEAVRIIPKKT